MSSEREKCGITSLLPVACRGRAEAFARSLHSKLRSLNAREDNGSSDESSWLGAKETKSNPVAVSQPRHSSDSELYIDFGLLESPGSPEERLAETELKELINGDYLKPSQDSSTNRLLFIPKSTSNDSDSDGPYYDTESESDKRLSLLNGSEKSENEQNRTVQSRGDDQQDKFISPPDEEDASTLSRKDSSDDSSNESKTESDSSEFGSVKECESLCNGNVEEAEVYVSSLTVEQDLVVECPPEVEAATKILEVDDTPKERDKETVYLTVNGKINNADEDEDEDYGNEEPTPRVRRCSSLKTGKTPPGTPGRKKIVRFADVLGLDLADVRTFLDEIPKIPISAYEDLTGVDIADSRSESNFSSSLGKFHGFKADKILMPLFQQPGGQSNFMDLVRDNKVCLENALVDDPLLLTVKGMVRVRNLDFHKSVHVRYSLDSWKTFADVQASYLENSCDGFSDKFSFLIYVHTLKVGQRLEFACRFQCKGCQYWDSNKGMNYCFQCLPATNSTVAPITAGLDDWGASFYY